MDTKIYATFAVCDDVKTINSAAVAVFTGTIKKSHALGWFKTVINCRCRMCRAYFGVQKCGVFLRIWLADILRTTISMLPNTLCHYNSFEVQNYATDGKEARCDGSVVTSQNVVLVLRLVAFYVVPLLWQDSYGIWWWWSFSYMR